VCHGHEEPDREQNERYRHDDCEYCKEDNQHDTNQRKHVGYFLTFDYLLSLPYYCVRHHRTQVGDPLLFLLPSTNQSTNQPTNQPINQSINQSLRITKQFQLKSRIN